MRLKAEILMIFLFVLKTYLILISCNNFKIKMLITFFLQVCWNFQDKIFWLNISMNKYSLIFISRNAAQIRFTHKTICIKLSDIWMLGTIYKEIYKNLNYSTTASSILLKFCRQLEGHIKSNMWEFQDIWMYGRGDKAWNTRKYLVMELD